MKEKLEKMGFEELVQLCYKQNKKIDEIRGYESGINIKMLSKMDKNTLIKCYLENAKCFNI